MKVQLKTLTVTAALFVGIVSTSAAYADEKSDPSGTVKGQGSMMQGGQGGMMNMMAQMNEMMTTCNKMMQDKAAHHGGHESAKPDQEKKS